MSKRVVVTGMSINTPLGDTLPAFLEGLLAGRSAISTWKAFPTDRVYSKVGGDLSHYDIAGKIAALADKIPAEVHKVGSSRVDLQACKLEYSIVSPK